MATKVGRPMSKQRQTAGESAASVAPSEANIHHDEGTWSRYDAPATDIPLVFNNTTAPRINKQDYLDGDWVLAGDPKTTPFSGTPEVALDTALLLAEDLGKGVKFHGIWTLDPLTDPDALGRTCSIYIPDGVSLKAMDRRYSSLNLADAHNGGLMAFRDPANIDTAGQDIGPFACAGNKANQTAASQPLIDLDPTAPLSNCYLRVTGLRIRQGYDALLRMGFELNGARVEDCWGFNSGATGTGSAGCAFQFNAADLEASGIDIAMSDGAGLSIGGVGMYTNVKVWRSGEVDSVNGHGVRASLGAAGLLFRGWVQDCSGDALRVFSASAGGGDLIHIVSDANGGVALRLGDFRDNGIYVVTANDRSGALYSHDFAIAMNGSNNNNNAIYVQGDPTVAVIDTTSANIGNNQLHKVGINTETFAASDATPSVVGGRVYLTDAGALTITDFDDGVAGQEITVISKGAVTFDTTATNLTGSSVDIVTAADDVTRWVCEDGTTWRLIAYVDSSVDNSAGA